MSIPIGSPNEIKKQFETILGPLTWSEAEDGGARSIGFFTKHGFEIILRSNDNLIYLKGCSQLQAIEIAKKLGVCAFDPQYGKQLAS